MKLTTRTLKRVNTWKTEYRIDSVYFDTYGKVTDIIDELNTIVSLFPEELRADVKMDMESDSQYATFWVEGIASKADADKAKAKEQKAKEDELARAQKQVAQLNAKIASLTKEVK